MSKGSTKTIGQYAGLRCPGCGERVTAAPHGGQWYHTEPPGPPQAWHFPCKLRALRHPDAARYSILDAPGPVGSP